LNLFQLTRLTQEQTDLLRSVLTHEAIGAGSMHAACQRVTDELGLCIEDDRAPPESAARVHPWKLYALAATLTTDLVDARKCQADALFRYSGAEMRDAAVRMSSRKAKKSAAMPRSRTRGGEVLPPVTDEAIKLALAKFQARGKGDRGMRKWLMGELGLSGPTIRKRLQGLGVLTK